MPRPGTALALAAALGSLSRISLAAPAPLVPAARAEVDAFADWVEKTMPKAQVEDWKSDWLDLRAAVERLPPARRRRAYADLRDFLSVRRKFVASVFQAKKVSEWQPPTAYLGAMLERWTTAEAALPGPAYRNRRLFMPENACPIRCGSWNFQGLPDGYVEWEQKAFVETLARNLKGEPYVHQALAAELYCSADTPRSYLLDEAAREARRAADGDSAENPAPYCTWLMASVAAGNTLGVHETIARALRWDPDNPFLTELLHGGGGENWTPPRLHRPYSGDSRAHRGMNAGPTGDDSWEISVKVLPPSAQVAPPAEIPRKRRRPAKVAFTPVTGLTPTDPAALPGLERILRTGERDERLHAVAELGNMGAPGLDALSGVLRDGDWQVRMTAVHWLGRIGPAGAESLTLAMRTDPCRLVRLTAVHWLGSLGPAYLPELGYAQDDPSPSMRAASRYWSHRAADAGDHSIHVDGDDVAGSREDRSVCEQMNIPRRRPGTEIARGPNPSPAPTTYAPPAPAQPPTRTPDAPPSPSQAFPSESDGPMTPSEAFPDGNPEQFPPAGSLARNDPPTAGNPTPHPNARTEPEPFVDPTARMTPQNLPPVPTPPSPSRAQTPAPPVSSPVRSGPNSEVDTMLGAPETFPPTPTAPAPPREQAPSPSIEPPEHKAPNAEVESLLGDPNGALPAPVSPRHEDAPVSADANILEGVQGPLTYDAIPALIELLSKGTPRKRARAADELGKMGTHASKAVVPLIAAMKDKEARVRACAALALGNIGPAADPAVKNLARALRDPSADVRYSAAVGLGRMGTPAARKAFERYQRELVGS